MAVMNNNISFNASNYFAKEVIQVTEELKKLAQTDEKTEVHQGTIKKNKSSDTTPKVIKKIVELIKKSYQVEWNANDNAVWASLEQGLKQYIIKHPEFETDKIVAIAQQRVCSFAHSSDLNYDIQLAHLDDISQKQPQNVIEDEEKYINMFLSIAAFEKLFFDQVGELMLKGKKMNEAREELIKRGGKFTWSDDISYALSISSEIIRQEISFDDLSYAVSIGKILNRNKNILSKLDSNNLKEVFHEVLQKYDETSEKKPFYEFLLAFIIHAEQEILFYQYEASLDIEHFGAILKTLFGEKYNTLQEKFSHGSQHAEFLFPTGFKAMPAYGKYMLMVSIRERSKEAVYKTLLDKAGSASEVVRLYQPQLNNIHSQDIPTDDQFYNEFSKLYDEYVFTLAAKKERYAILYTLSRRIFLSKKKDIGFVARKHVQFPFDHMIDTLPTIKEFSEYIPATYDSSSIEGVALQILNEHHMRPTHLKDDESVDMIEKQISQLTVNEKKSKNAKRKSRISAKQQKEVVSDTSQTRSAPNSSSDSINNNSANFIPTSSNSSAVLSLSNPCFQSGNSQAAVDAAVRNDNSLSVEPLEEINCSNHVWRWFDPLQNPFDDENYSTQAFSEKKQKWLRLCHEIPLVVAHLATQNTQSHNFVDPKTQVDFDAYTIGAELDSAEFGKVRGVCTFGFKKGTNELCHSYFSKNIQESQMIMDYLTHGFLRYDFPTLAESCEKSQNIKKSYVVNLRNEQVATDTQKIAISSRASEFCMPDGKSKLRVFF